MYAGMGIGIGSGESGGARSVMQGEVQVWKPGFGAGYLD